MKISRAVYQAIAKHPEAYEEGAQAAEDDKDPSYCKYAKDTAEWLAWRAGWLGVS